MFHFVARQPLDEMSYVDVDKLVARFAFPDAGTMARALAPLGLEALARAPDRIGFKVTIGGARVHARAEGALELWIVITPREPSPALRQADRDDAAAATSALEAAGLRTFLVE